jgi:hypothetical protein
MYRTIHVKDTVLKTKFTRSRADWIHTRYSKGQAFGFLFRLNTVVLKYKKINASLVYSFYFMNFWLQMLATTMIFKPKQCQNYQKVGNWISRHQWQNLLVASLFVTGNEQSNRGDVFSVVSTLFTSSLQLMLVSHRPR